MLFNAQLILGEDSQANPQFRRECINLHQFLTHLSLPILPKASSSAGKLIGIECLEGCPDSGTKQLCHMDKNIYLPVLLYKPSLQSS